jgi:hypothetical protein
MATLTAKLDLSVSGITSDAISFTGLSQTKTVLAGGITSRTITDTATAGETIVEQTYYAEGTMIYLKNRGTENINIELSAGVTEIVLGGGEWAFFPWKAAVDMKAFSTAGGDDPVLEVGIFSAA